MVGFLTVLLLLTCSSTVLSQASSSIELVLSPESRLLPVGTNATFTCQFRHVQDADRIFWVVNGIEANNHHNIPRLINLGYTILKQERNGIVTLTLTVNGQYQGINNTHIQCRTLGDVHSQPATILTIAEQPITPNPSIEQSNISTLSLKWSPPFLWPGYFIKNYTISVRNNSNGEMSTYQVNSVTFSEAVIKFSFLLNESYQHCSEYTFGITPGRQDLVSRTHYVTAVLNCNFTAIVLFRADGTPLIRALVEVSTVCSYQNLDITLIIRDKSTKALVTTDGPILHHGNNSFEYDIVSNKLEREREYNMTVILDNTFEVVTKSSLLNTWLDSDLYPTYPPCTSGIKSAKAKNVNLFVYQVGMGVSLGLAVLMLFTLICMLITFLVCRKRKIFKGKNISLSTNRMQNNMVNNPIYDGPVYESVQPHFDTLTATVKQDLSLSNTSTINTRDFSTPPNSGNSNNSQTTARYLDRPLQLRSQSLSNPSMPTNNNQRLTTICAPARTRMMGLKKDGKERNKLHLTLTLNGNESANPPPGKSCRKDDAGSADDENYALMSPIKRKFDKSKIERVTEQSPEDTDKYKEEVNDK